MNIAHYIDHTVLKQDTTAADVIKLCQEAQQEGFAAVCIPPYYVQLAKEQLKDTDVKVATVIGFPLGYQTLNSKLQEIKDAIEHGADELDMVHNIAALKNENWSYLEKEVSACTALAHQHGKAIKVIVESGIITEEELKQCCAIYGKLAIDYMKTSTGFAAKGANVASVKTMRELLPDNVKIKAAGGIRNYGFAKELIDAGADRLGCSAGMRIVNEHKEL